MYKILVVDDEEMIRRLIAKYATFEGHTVVEAGDGMEAVMKRVRASAKPTNGAPANEIVDLGGLKADITARIVYIDGERADMSPKEYELFFYMLKNRNIALSRDKLLSEVWGYDYFGDDRTLDTHIKLLRRSLGKYADYIVTLRGVGYRFDTGKIL